MKSKSFGIPPTIDTIVCIEWLDASSQSGTLSRDELTEVPYKLLTVGWLIRETDEQISVCMDYIPKDDHFRDVQHILKRNVVKRREFKCKR